MGNRDTATAVYMRRPEIFADAFNYYIYDGKKVIDPASLVELDTREIAVPYGGEDASQPVQRTRDVIKSVTAMTDQKMAYLILAVENQSNIHYAMPVRNMTYDALQYARQVELAIASHRKHGDYRHADADEYLSGFMRGDRLLPVMTLVVYFGDREWDGPMSVHEMFGDVDPLVLKCIPDYRINLIAPANMTEDDFEKLDTTLRAVLKFFRYAKDAQSLYSVMHTDTHFQHLGRDEVNLLNTCAGTRLTLPEKKEECNMCIAFEQYKAMGKAEGEAEGRIVNLSENIKSLMTTLGLPVEQAMDALMVPEAERAYLLERLG